MKKIFKWIRNIIILLLIIGIGICSYVVYDGYQLYKNAITNKSIEEAIKEIENKKYYVTKGEIPKDFKDALVAIEDNRFYNHGAIDLRSIGRAIVTNIKEMKLVEGGSTITQQLAKNMYFSFEKKFSRKVAEVFVGMDLEKKYNKDEILSYYINIIYFGDGYYGLGAASRGYYEKPVERLTFDECTMLAGLPNAPSAYALSTNPDLAQERKALVVEQMKKYGYLK
ncbi:MAG: transglycosylase domain-containing protein [Clostridia bacterium]|nr:transglycosylase domain-containing protein [Clostridia bacterium]